MNQEQILEKVDEFIVGLKTNDVVSNCCSATVWQPTKEWAQCMDCKEYCDAVKLE